MTRIWTSRYDKKPGVPTQCRASVVPKGHSFGWLHQHQCERKPVVFRCVDGAEYGFCKQHDPEAVKARGDARRAAWQAEWDENREKERLRKATSVAMEACKAAIEQIAAGHNDPRTLAIAALAVFPEPALPHTGKKLGDEA